MNLEVAAVLYLFENFGRSSGCYLMIKFSQFLLLHPAFDFPLNIIIIS